MNEPNRILIKIRKALTLIEDHLDSLDYDLDYMAEHFIMYIVNDILQAEKDNLDARWPDIVEDTIERFIADNS